MVEQEGKWIGIEKAADSLGANKDSKILFAIG